MSKISQEAVDYCRNLGNGTVTPYRIYWGLCANMWIKWDILISELIHFDKYPNFSGNEDYPVKSEDADPKDAYSNNKKYNSLWADSEYGNERRKFCLWVADELEKLLNKQENENE